VNIICRAESPKTSRHLAEAVRSNNTDPGTGLAGWHGTFDATLEDSVMSETPKAEGSMDHWHDIFMTFSVSWYETP
jgi:hypothetical protein